MCSAVCNASVVTQLMDLINERPSTMLMSKITFLLTSHLIQEVTGQLCHGLKFSMSPLVALVDQVHIRSVILFKLKKYANMGFVDWVNELESERSALIIQRPTETGGCGGCRR